jgi:lipoprotein-anchoring transpeptidase ErfK/SrfK
MKRAGVRAGLAPFALALSVAGLSSADGGMPPWFDPGDLPVPAWAKAAVPIKDDQPLSSMPDSAAPRRGSVAYAARLPLYGAKRGPGCEGRWLLVGPYAWICSDSAELVGQEPMLGAPRPEGFLSALPGKVSGEGLPYRYYFVGKEGASGFHDLAYADEEAPDQDFEAGFTVAIVEERSAHGEMWGRTRRGEWIALRELGAIRPVSFKGETVGPAGSLDFAWVAVEKASVFSASSGGKVTGNRSRSEVVSWREEKASPGGTMVRISEDGTPPAWMRAKDLVRQKIAPPPDEIGGAAASERWIDVELATQSLVAYEGTRPVYATLVSSGRGPVGSDTITPPGVHRIWVKLLSTSMGNLQNEDADEHYLIEEVPYVQFFDKAVALHGAFWHNDFGHVHSHGCVNLAPVDAEWLFGFTSPHLPAGWSAALPAPVEKGTLVRVR